MGTQRYDDRNPPRTEEDGEEARTHPDWLRGVPPAPPEVVASHFEGTRKEEAGHNLPEDEKTRR